MASSEAISLTQFSAWRMWDFNSRCVIKKSRMCKVQHASNSHTHRTSPRVPFSSRFSWRRTTRACEVYCSYLIRAVCLLCYITIRMCPFLHIVSLLSAHMFGTWLGPNSVAGAAVDSMHLLCLSALTEIQECISVKLNGHLCHPSRKASALTLWHRYGVVAYPTLYAKPVQSIL